MSIAYLAGLSEVIEQAKWNERPLTYPALEKICGIYNIEIVSAPLERYECISFIHDGHLVLALRDTLAGYTRLINFIHALTHALLYFHRFHRNGKPPPDNGHDFLISACNPSALIQGCKLPEHPDELAALVLSTCGALPKPFLHDKTAEDLQRDYQISQPIIDYRFLILWEFEL